MHISPVSFRASSQTQTKTKQPEKKEETLKELFEKEGIEIPEPKPLQVGIGNFLVWSVSGFVFDRLLNKIPNQLFKTSTKQALLINGGIGLGAGCLGYFKSKKAEKNKTSNDIEKASE